MHSDDLDICNVNDNIYLNCSVAEHSNDPDIFIMNDSILFEWFFCSCALPQRQVQNILYMFMINGAHMARVESQAFWM